MSPLATRTLHVLGLAAYLALIAICFVVAAYLSFNVFVRSGVTTAPDLTGLTVVEAEKVLADQGLKLRRSEAEGRFDPDVAAGHVARQDPRARTLVKRGSTVEVVLSLGPERLEVPDVVGRSVQAAQVTLAGAGLAVGRTLHVFSHRAAGTVVEEEPGVGAAVAPKSPVDLLIAVDDPDDSYVMPDLVYRSYDGVRAFFEGRGFRFGSIKFERYEGVAAGVILRQFPVAGHPVSHADAISLVVAAPPDEALPDGSGE